MFDFEGFWVDQLPVALMPAFQDCLVPHPELQTKTLVAVHTLVSYTHIYINDIHMYIYIHIYIHIHEQSRMYIYYIIGITCACVY